MGPPGVHSGAPWAEIEELRKSASITLVGAIQCGVDQNISLTMPSDRPGLSGAMGISDMLENPTVGKFDAAKARRAGLVRPGEHGLLAIMGPNGMSYTNTFGHSVWRQRRRTGAV